MAAGEGDDVKCRKKFDGKTLFRLFIETVPQEGLRYGQKAAQKQRLSMGRPAVQSCISGRCRTH